MRSLFAFVLCLLTVSAVAQNAPITTQTFSFNAQAISLPGNKGTFAGTDAGLTFSPTQNLSFEEANLLSSDARMTDFLGLAEYDFPFVSKWINNQTPSLSGFRLRVGVRAGAGVSRVKDAFGNVQQHYSALAQGTFSYSLDSGGTWQLGGHFGALRAPYFAKGWTPVVEFGPQFHF